MGAGDGAGRWHVSGLTAGAVIRSAARLGERLLVGLDRLAQPRARAAVLARMARFVRVPVLVGSALVVVLATLGGSVVVISALIGGVGAAAQAPSPPTPAHRNGRTVIESMKIVTGKLDGKPDSPRFTNPSWTVHKGDTVVLRITNYDDGPAPLTGAQRVLGSVQGTVGGTETVDGKPVRSLSAADVSHTFTVIGLGLNLPIPAAPSGGAVTVVARFVANRTGRFVWQCYAPCGAGPNFTGGAMSVAGWMEGKVRVAS
jgi:FtsP/CotA-like multicopper oxidase with cupredoxin domain